MTEIIINYIFCILILGVIIFGINFQKDIHNKTTRRFMQLVITVMLQILTLLISEVLEGKEKYTLVICIFNYLGFILVDVVLCQFMRYIMSIIEDYKDKKVKVVYAVFVASAIRVIVITVLALIGKLFRIEHGYYVEGELEYVPYIMTGFIMILPIICLIQNKKCFSTRRFVVMLLYVLIPVIPVAVEMLTGIYTLTPVAVTISLLLVYVLVQDSAMETVKTRQTILEELSYTDLLTGLNNRRSYYECIQNIDEDSNVGAVFCDLNGLKYTNDHFGHASGDALIKKFANILVSTFDENEVFRISGDEFVVILQNIDKDTLNKQVALLEIAIKNSEDIASFGYEYGKGCKLEHLISEAEKKMYENKRSYYEKRQEQRENS